MRKRPPLRANAVDFNGFKQRQQRLTGIPAGVARVRNNVVPRRLEIGIASTLADADALGEGAISLTNGIEGVLCVADQVHFIHSKHDGFYAEQVAPGSCGGVFESRLPLRASTR